MKAEESPDYPEVIWESSIPDSWHRIFAKKQPRTRPPTSKSVRTLRTAQACESDHQLTTFDHLYRVDSSARPHTSPKVTSESFYTVKYLGITNGEIGILSQRKPLTSPKSLARTRPSTQQMSRLTMSAKELSTPPSFYMQSMEAAKDVFPAEFLKPDPWKYDEYLVHTYSRPRRLNSVKKEAENSHNAPLEAIFRPATAIKPLRKGVSGWKLTRPKSHSALFRKKGDGNAGKEKRKTVLLEPLGGKEAKLPGEAYIQYLLLKKKAKAS